MYEESNNINDKLKKRIASKIINKNTQNQTNIIRAEICDHKLKLTLLNILIIIIFLIMIHRFIIKPYFFDYKENNILLFHKIIKKYYNKYTSSKHIFLFILFILIIIIFISLNIEILQNIGIVLLITFITAIAQEGEEFLLGALFSGISVYIFIRIKTYFGNNNYKLDKCGDNIFTIIKKKFNINN